MKKVKLLVAVLIGSFQFATAQQYQWNTIFNPIDGLEAIWCFDTLQCVVVGQDGFIAKTTSGDSTWVQKTSGATELLQSIFCIEDTCFVGGENTLLKSIDRGETWFSIPHPIMISGRIYKTWFYNSQIGFAYDYSGSGYFWRTNDGGQSWIDLDPLAGMFPAGGIIRSLYFTSPDTGYLSTYGTSYYILKTTDGGFNWSILHTSTFTAIEDLTFVNDSTGFFAGHSTILKTTNRGLTFDTLNFPYDTALFSIFATDENTLYVGGQAIAKTSDGGETWLLQPKDVGASVQDIYFPHRNIGFAVTGNVLKVRENSVGIAEVTKGKHQLNIYPNPIEADKIVHINLKNLTDISDCRLTIYDLIGRNVKDVLLSDFNNSISLTHLVGGMYLFKVATNKEIIGGGKIIIK